MALLPTLPLSRWLVLSHGVVLFLPVVVLVGTGALRTDLQQQTRDDLDHQAALLALHVGDILLAAPGGADLVTLGPALSKHLRAARARTPAGFRVVDQQGVVVATSGEGLGEELGEQPEVRLALGGEVGEGLRSRPHVVRDAPLSSQSRRAAVRVVLASPIHRGPQVVGAVVLNRTPREELQTLWQMAPRLWGGVAAAIVLTVGLALLSGWRLSRTLGRVARAAHRVAAGELGAAADLPDATESHVKESAELARALSLMTGRLRERLRYATELAGNLSHELKTPLSTLRGTIELLRDDDAMEPAQRDRFLDHALQDLDRTTRLVSGLLQLARAEEAAPTDIVRVDEILRHVASRWEGLVVHGRAGPVRAHRAQLESAVGNLIENAFQHGGAEVRVRLACDEVDGACQMDVEDDGPGISPGNLPRIWDRFFTTGRDRGGTGLGLSLVRAVAVAHGGTVSVESRPGRTLFRLRLPGMGPS